MSAEPDIKPISDEKILYRIKKFEKEIAELLGTKPTGTLIHVLLENDREMLLQSDAPDLATSYRRYYMTVASLLRKIRSIYNDDREFCFELCRILNIICDNKVMFDTKFLDQMARYPGTPLEDLPKDINELN